MKVVRWIIISMLLSALAIPILAQQAKEQRMTGKVLAVDARANQCKVAFTVKVEDINAPGKMPDDIAQLAATLTDQAEKLEKAGHADMAHELRRKIEECRHWRLVEEDVPGATPMLGVSRLPLGQAKVGMKLRMMVSADGVVGRDVIPEKVTLNRQATEVDAQEQPLCRRMNNVPGAGKTFFQLVGTVVGVNPLVVSVNDANITVDNQANHALMQQKKVGIGDLQAGQRVAAWARVSGTDITQITRMMVLLTDANEKFSPDDEFVF